MKRFFLIVLLFSSLNIVFSQGFQKGTNENMKAIQTILKSGDNVQQAIKDFVANQAKSIADPEPKTKNEVKPNKE